MLQSISYAFFSLILGLGLSSKAAVQVSCVSLFNAKSVSEEVDYNYVFRKLIKDRPDVAEALIQNNPRLMKSNSEAVSESFLRAKLKKYFIEEPDSIEPVVLYRGIDAESISTSFIGEGKLIWTSRNIKDALDYSLGNSTGLKRVFILKIIVPKYMVYERSGWPTLRYEDVIDLAPFIAKVAVIPVTASLNNFIDRHRGESDKLRRFVEKNYFGLLEGTSRHWRRLEDIRLFVQSNERFH